MAQQSLKPLPGLPVLPKQNRKQSTIADHQKFRDKGQIESSPASITPDQTRSGWTFFALMHLACLGVFAVGWSWAALAGMLAMYVLRMFAITGFYHRYFSHRSFKTSRLMQFIFAFWGATAAQQGALWWAAHHRHHHPHSDQTEDLHSPRQHGFWHAHIGWVPENVKADFSRIPDLTRYPELVWLDKQYLLAPIVAAASLFVLGEALQSWGTTGWQMLIWGFFVSTVLLYHGTFSINSLSHVYGSQRYDTGDDSRNNFWLALLTLGEGWHNNHHYYATSTRQGFYWWEIDITFYGLWLMARLGLIWNLKQVPEHLKQKHRQIKI